MEKKPRFERYFEVGLFLFGLFLAAFALGLAVGVYHIFPYKYLRQAGAAADSLILLVFPVEEFVTPVEGEREDKIRWDRNLAFNGYTFFTAYRDGLFGAYLIDMEGNTVYQWKIAYSEVWPAAEHLRYQARDSRVAWHGAHLYPNGDIVFNFNNGHFPNGGGLVKINKRSDVIWALPKNTHHDIYVAEDQTIWVPSQDFNEEGNEHCYSLVPPYYEDTLLHVSAKGEIIEEISILDSICDSDFRGLFSMQGDRPDVGVILSDDPTHLNNVELLSAELSDSFPMFQTGDILVSLRNINTIAVIDSDSKKVKWSLSGLFAKQHDPDFLPDGSLLVFDNRALRNGLEESRVVEIDPVTQKVLWEFRASDGDSFYTFLRGKQSILPNGNVLITESQTGRILEVSRDSDEPKIVWEFVNYSENDMGAGTVTQADRFLPEALQFLE